MNAAKKNEKTAYCRIRFSVKKLRWILPEPIPEAVVPLCQELKKLEEKEQQLYNRLERDGPFQKRKKRGPGRYKKR